MKSKILIIALTVVTAAFAQSPLLRRPGGASAGARTAPSAAPNAAPAAAVRPPSNAAPAESIAGASKSGEASAFNWDAAPVDIVLQAYGERLGKTILKDPQVPSATITLKSREGQKLSQEEYLEAIEIILEMNQIHLEPYGDNFIRALPRKDVRKEGIPLIMDSETRLKESGKVVSMMISFKNIAIEEAQKALEGLKSNSGLLLVFERTNSILVTDTEQNINRMLEIARMIDIASPVTEVVEYIQIKYASANEVKQVIDSIVQESMKDQEKNGKMPQNQHQPSTLEANRPSLLSRRPGQPNASQNNAPVNNQSLVMTVSDADRGMIRGKVVTIADERSNKILLITNASNMKFFKEVIAALDVETTPDTVVKVYRLKYAEAEDVSDMINDLIGNSSSSKSSGKSNQNQASKTGTSGSVTKGSQAPTQMRKPANQRTGDVKAGELNKDNTTVLADKRINGIVVMTQKELVPTIENIIESMDIKLSQVLIETCIIEVTLGDDLQTGIDWVQRGRQRQIVQATDALGNKLYWDEDEDGNCTQTTEETGLPVLISKIVRDAEAGFFNNGSYMLGGGGGSGSAALKGLVGVGADSAASSSGSSGDKETQALASSAALATVNPIAGGINYLLKSDKLNIAAVINAAKSDNRAKYIASPVIMTVDNKEATIEATEARKFFNGYETSSSYSTYVRTPKYDSKDIGITIKITPKINPNGTVMLNVEEEYSQLGAGQSILVDDGGLASIDTALTRKMSADVLLENMQTVVLGGLTERYTSEKESGIPILKDIPYIGKWLFGTVSQSESRKELLVFMTPYVLEDSDAAQAEALRRKKSLSDVRAWDDNGWSASNLADPVSRKEQMRRIKEEWAKQDEERKTKIAIEKMKVERAEKLKELSKDERELWLKMHKDELEKEQREELEEKMQDEASQEELRKLAAQIREKKLAAAEKEIKESEAIVAEENERSKLDAAK